MEKNSGDFFTRFTESILCVFLQANVHIWLAAESIKCIVEEQAFSPSYDLAHFPYYTPP